MITALNHAVLGNLLEQAVNDGVVTREDAVVAYNVLVTLDGRDPGGLVEVIKDVARLEVNA